MMNPNSDQKGLTMMSCAHAPKDSVAPRQKFLETDDGLMWFRWCGEKECEVEYTDMIKLWQEMIENESLRSSNGAPKAQPRP